MGCYCIVKNCKNFIRRKGSAKRNRLEFEGNAKKVTYHSFPKDPIRRQQWASYLVLKVEDITDNHKVCSDHFSKDAFDRSSLSCVRLRSNACPIHHEKINDDANSQQLSNETNFWELVEVKCEELSESSSVPEETSEELGSSSSKRRLIISEDIESSSQRKEHDNQNSPSDRLKTCEENSIGTQTDDEFSSSKKRYVDRQTSVSPERILHSPTKERLRNSHKKELEKLRNQMRIISQRLRRAEKRIAEKETVFEKLRDKKYLGEEQLSNLADIGKANNDLLKRQVRKITEGNKPRQYSPELREFALTLHCYSPDAYRYVREKFHTCLPHSKTISKWYRTENGEPSLCSEASESIEVKEKDAGHPSDV